MKYGRKEEIPIVDEHCPVDVFENAIREFGTVAACEWFGHECNSEFTKETIKVLCEKSNIKVTGE